MDRDRNNVPKAVIARSLRRSNLGHGPGIASQSLAMTRTSKWGRYFGSDPMQQQERVSI